MRLWGSSAKSLQVWSFLSSTVAHHIPIRLLDVASTLVCLIVTFYSFFFYSSSSLSLPIELIANAFLQNLLPGVASGPMINIFCMASCD